MSIGATMMGMTEEDYELFLECHEEEWKREAIDNKECYCENCNETEDEE